MSRSLRVVNPNRLQFEHFRADRFDFRVQFLNGSRNPVTVGRTRNTPASVPVEPDNSLGAVGQRTVHQPPVFGLGGRAPVQVAAIRANGLNNIAKGQIVPQSPFPNCGKIAKIAPAVVILEKNVPIVAEDFRLDHVQKLLDVVVVRGCPVSRLICLARVQINETQTGRVFFPKIGHHFSEIGKCAHMGLIRNKVAVNSGIPLKLLDYRIQMRQQGRNVGCHIRFWIAQIRIAAHKSPHIQKALHAKLAGHVHALNRGNNPEHQVEIGLVVIVKMRSLQGRWIPGTRGRPGTEEKFLLPPVAIGDPGREGCRHRIGIRSKKAQLDFVVSRDLAGN